VGKEHLAAALRVALIYAAVGALWIVFSDRLLYLAVPDTARLTALQTYKGWAFVAGSAALIYGLLRRELAAHARAAERQRRILEAAAEGICGLDPEGRVTFSNPAAAEITGYTPEELLGRRLHDLVHHTRPDGTPFPWEECPACRTLVTGEVHAGVETLFWRRDGTGFEAEVSSAPIKEGEAVVGAVVAFRDVTPRRRMQRRLARLASMHGLLASVSRAVTVAGDRDELFRKTCRMAVELGSFRLAWIGLVQDDVDYVAPVAQWGDEEGYLEEVRVAAQETSLGRGPAGRAVREGRPFVCNDIAQEPRMELWREAALRRGYRSSAAFPLRVGSRVVGVLSLYAAEPGFFDEETASLLARLADDISLALSAFEHAERSRQAEEQLAYLATYDPLTGLPNRYLLEEALGRALRRVRQGRPAALLLLEVDNLAVVVNTLGHAAGDLVLAAVAGLLPQVCPPACLVARAGERQFAALIEDLGPEEARAAAEHVRRAVEGHPFETEGQEFWLTVSGGLTVLEGREDPRAALMQADAALRAAREKGGNRVVAFRPGDEAFSGPAEAGRLAFRIREALDRSLFALFFQPIVDLHGGRVVHYEALLRLRTENGHFVPAGELIPAAEGTGLMPRIERWVIRSALEVLRTHPGLRLFVNLSGASLGDEDLLDFIAQVLGAGGIDPYRLGFEITETAAVRDLPRAERWLRRLKALGCPLALDDFGAGFSSFAYLRALPVDYLKIDGGYVRDVDQNPTHRALVQAMSTAARALGKKTVAEFVESATVLETLRALGVDYGQGYFLGRPAPLSG
jgi:diguanylate cyclase (GGDEF)-like protein/PAS domain S-box-containing protein